MFSMPYVVLNFKKNKSHHLVGATVQKFENTSEEEYFSKEYSWYQHDIK
jgi:hypothetical protein